MQRGGRGLVKAAKHLLSCDGAYPVVGGPCRALSPRATNPRIRTWRRGHPLPAGAPVHRAAPLARRGPVVQHGGVLVPFSLRLTPPLRLLLITLADDSVYADLEVQWARDTSGNEGAVVLAVRRADGTADVHVQDTLDLAAADYDIGAGLASFTSVHVDSAAFVITPRGVRLDVTLPLADGRVLEVVVEEARRGPRPLVRMLAPAGHAMTDPQFFPFFWMHDIWFLRWRGATVRVTVDGQARRVRRVGAPWQLARYAVHPLTGLLCPRHDGAVPVVPDEPGRHRLAGSTVQVVAGPALQGLTVARGEQSLGITFEPPVPELDAAPRGTTDGRFTLWAGGRPQLGGSYAITSGPGAARLALVVDRPWDPGPQPASARAVFRALAVFRTWPTTYRWDATLRLGDRPALMTSRWTRTTRGTPPAGTR